MLQDLIKEINESLIIAKSLGIGKGESVYECISNKKYTKEECIELAIEMGQTKPNNTTALILHNLAIQAGYKYKIYDTLLDKDLKLGKVNRVYFAGYDITKDETMTVFATDMSKLYSNYDIASFRASYLTFNTSNVTNMEKMFEKAKIDDIYLGRFETHNVEDMTHMFYRFQTKNKLDIKSFSADSLVEAFDMFDSVIAEEIIIKREFIERLAKNLNKTYRETYKYLGLNSVNAKITILD